MLIANSASDINNYKSITCLFYDVLYGYCTFLDLFWKCHSWKKMSFSRCTLRNTWRMFLITNILLISSLPLYSCYKARPFFHTVKIIIQDFNFFPNYTGHSYHFLYITTYRNEFYFTFIVKQFLFCQVWISITNSPS